jgi:general secretion pathway protein D
MHLRNKFLILCLAAIVPMSAMAQFDFGGGATSAASAKKPWEGLKLNPKTRIKLDFRNANIDMILALFQKTSGVSIVKDPALVDRLSITSAKAIPLKDAFQILSTTLSLKGFDLVKEDSLLVIKKRVERPQAAPAFDPSMFASMMGGNNKSDLKVYPVKFASASALARVLNEVFASQDQGGGGFPFNLFGGGGGGGAARFGGRGGGNPFAQLGRGQSAPSVKASSDDFSNSVIVNAPSEQQRDVADLIKQLDKETDAPQKPIVYKLEYAVASEVQPTIQTVLTANAPKGRGQTSNQNQGGGGFGGFFGAFRQNQNTGQGSVTSDTRSNSLIVTATAENQELVSQIVKELDKDVPIQSSTFVIPLDNARADSVANLLNQAFGQRTGTGTNRGGTTNTGRTGTNNQNRNNQNRNNGGGGLGGNNNLTPDGLAVDLANPNADEGELLTRVGVAQGFGFFGGQGFGGGQNNQNRNQNPPARDASGRIVNIRDLAGQVTTIADPNTNSIIVVGTPESAELVKSIIGQLDKIPEQVMIETLIVEATLDETNKFGFEWKYAQDKAFNQKGVTGNAATTFPGTQDTTNGGFKYTITGGNLDVIVNALKTDDRFQVLSTPKIFTSNNVQAEINISQSVPYVLSSREDANGNLTYNYAFQDVGIVLNVTPRITANGFVTMDVTQTANDLQGYTSFNAPIVNQRQADTTVSVRDGETIVLGGIIRSTVSSKVRKVPILGDLPILGELFKSSSKTKQKTELLVFLTPRVVRDDMDAKNLRERTVKGLSPAQQKEVNKAIPPKTGIPPTTPVKKTEEKKTEDKKTGGNS